MNEVLQVKKKSGEQGRLNRCNNCVEYRKTVQLVAPDKARGKLLVSEQAMWTLSLQNLNIMKKQIAGRPPDSVQKIDW